MKFTNAYAACTVCSPTRASIMTGMYPARLRLTDFIPGQNRPFAKLEIPDWNKGLDPSHITIAEALRDAGYVTAQVGKWHLNHAGRSPTEYGPTSHGFQFEFPQPRGTRGYSLPKGTNRMGESGSDYLTDYLTDQACAFIDDSRDKPFFLYFAYHIRGNATEDVGQAIEEERSSIQSDRVSDSTTSQT